MVAKVYVQTCGPSPSWLEIDRNAYLSYDQITTELKKSQGIDKNFNVPFKLFYGRQEICPGTVTPWPLEDAFINVTLSLCGGKGGFGSMLRAIGAQIEKTTNREACRDLSGRRLRDINEEKRLKDWVSKQADREKEKEERKKKKLEKLRQEFKCDFNDPEYYKERSEVTDKVHEALEQGIQASSSGEPPQKKLKAVNSGKGLKKSALWTGVSDDEDDSDSDDEHQSPADKKPDDSQSIPEEITESQPVNPSLDEIKEVPKDTHSPEPAAAAVEIMIEKKSPVPPPAEPKEYLPIDLDALESCQDLESLGLDHLKCELMRRGLKCGGTLSERASRLFSIKGLSPDEIDPSLLAKPPKKSNKK